MAVYVDDMYRYPMGRFGRMKMSHMVADTLDELNAMADAIGVQRKWIQDADRGHGYVHYDVCMSARKKAIELGAVELTLQDLSKMCLRWRNKRRQCR